MKRSLITRLSCLLGYLACCLPPFATILHAEKQEFSFDDTQSIVVKVSESGLTRISVQGDRLREVIGLDDTVIVEKDDANGHLFLKGVKTKQTITIVTEGGALQDLTLMPGARGSTTILLKNEAEGSKKDLNPEPFLPTSFRQSLQSQMHSSASTANVDALISVIKHLAAGRGKPCTYSDTRTAAVGLDAVLTHQLNDSVFVGFVFSVTNTRDSAMVLCEKDFYQNGDLSLCLSKCVLEPGETANLYVVRNDGGQNVT